MCEEVVSLMADFTIETVLLPLMTKTLLELIRRYVAMCGLHYFKKNQLIFPASQAFLVNQIKWTKYS